MRFFLFTQARLGGAEDRCRFQVAASVIYAHPVHSSAQKCHAGSFLSGCKAFAPKSEWGCIGNSFLLIVSAFTSFFIVP